MKYFWELKRMFASRSYAVVLFGLGILLVLLIVISHVLFIWFHSSDQLMPTYSRIIRYSVEHENTYLSLLLFDRLLQQKLIQVQYYYWSHGSGVADDVRLKEFPTKLLSRERNQNINQLLKTINWQLLPEENFSEWSKLLASLSRVVKQGGQEELSEYYSRLALIFDPSTPLTY